MEHMFPNVRLLRESSVGQGAFVERDGKSGGEKSAGEQGNLLGSQGSCLIRWETRQVTDNRRLDLGVFLVPFYPPFFRILAHKCRIVHV